MRAWATQVYNHNINDCCINDCCGIHRRWIWHIIARQLGTTQLALFQFAGALVGGRNPQATAQHSAESPDSFFRTRALPSEPDHRDI
jgi:hypothetical protein